MAGYDIGPRISLKGAKEFTNSIQNINNSLKEYKSELNALDADIENNGASTEKLAQRQQLLQKLIDTQNKKISLYKTELDKLTKTQDEQAQSVQRLTQARNDAQAKLDALKNSESATTAEIQKATQELAEHQKRLNNASSEYQSTSNKISQFKTGINETDRYVSNLSGELRQTDKSLSDLKSGAGDAASGLDEVGSASNNTGQALSDIKGIAGAGLFLGALSKAQEFLQVLQQIAQECADISKEYETTESKLRVAFGETEEEAKNTRKALDEVMSGGLTDSVEEAGNAIQVVKENLKGITGDELASVSEKAMMMEQVFGSDMSETMRGVNALMEQYKISATEAMDYMIAGAQNGLDKTDELGDNIADYAGNFQQAGFSTEEYFQLLDNGLQNGAYSLDQVNNAVREFSTRLSDGTIEENMSMFSSETKNVFDQWKNGQADVSDVMNSVSADIRNCTNEQQKMNMASTAFGTVGEDAGYKFVQSLSSVGTAYDNVAGKSDQALNDSKNVWTDLQGNINDFKASLEPVGEMVGGALNGVFTLFEGIGAKIAETYEENEWFKQGVSEIQQKFQGLVKDVQTTIENFYNEHKETIDFIFNTVIKSAIDTISGIIDKIKILWDVVWWVLDKIFDGIDWLVNGINELANGDLFQTITDIQNWFKNLPSNVWNSLCSFVNNIAQWGQDTYNSATKWTNDTINNVKQFFANLPSNVWNSLVQFVSNIGKWGVDTYNEATSAISDTIDGITKFFTDLPGKALDWGKDMIQGFIDGIKNMIGGITDAVGNIGNTIKEWLHFSRPDKGPLREYEKWMPDFMKGLAKGIHDNKYRVLDEIKDLSKNMTIDNDWRYQQTVRENQKIVVEVPVNMNKKTIARVVSDVVTVNKRGKAVAVGG